MRRRTLTLGLLAALLLTACGAGQPAGPGAGETPAGEETVSGTPGQEVEKTLTLMIENTWVPVVWEDNDSVAALTELVTETPLTVSLSMYGGFEQVGTIGTGLPRNDTHLTAAPGDIVLYAGDQIVLFYGSHSWAYTRLGHIELSREEMTELLGNGAVTVTLKAEG